MTCKLPISSQTVISSLRTAKNDTGHTVRISGGNCYIRTASNTAGKILGVAHKGDVLPFGGEVSPAGWLLVQYKNQNAWVSGKYGKVE